MFDLTGKAALVTGASGGIGGAIARALHGQGAIVTLSGTRAEALEQLKTSLVEDAHVGTTMTDVLTEDQKKAILGRVPADRLGTPEEIAAGAVYLASDEAAYITGQTLHINGGMAMI